MIRLHQQTGSSNKQSVFCLFFEDLLPYNQKSSKISAQCIMLIGMIQQKNTLTQPDAAKKRTQT